jgi:hypothetical protein
MPGDVLLAPVLGDPEGMRLLAAALRNDAATLALVAEGAASTLDGLEFFGPAATRIDDRVAGDTRVAGRIAAELADTAAVLERSASEVEAQQIARERQLERLRQEARPR